MTRISLGGFRQRPLHGVALMGLGACVLFLGACPKRSRAPVPTTTGAEAAGGRTTGASAGRLVQQEWSFLAAAHRAEVDQEGLFIDGGTADDHKYTRGGWRTGWGDVVTGSDGVTARAVQDETARLTLQLTADQKPAAVALRVRSDIPGQRLTVLLDGVKLKTLPVGRRWRVERFPVGTWHLQPGPTEIRLVTAKEQSGAARLLVDWVWLPREVKARPPAPEPRVAPLSLGGVTRRALLAPRPRRYRFYVEVPQGAHLAVSYGSRGATTFTVAATPNYATQARRLWQAAARRDGWQEASIDLTRYAGEALRLDLTTTGDAAAAGWGEPEIRFTARRWPVAGTPPRHIVMVLLDSLRADALRPVNPTSPAVAPTLESLAREGTTLTGAIAAASWTKPSMASLLTGLYPSTHRVHHFHALLPAEIPTLATVLHGAGFRTALFNDNPLIRRSSGFGRGWDLFRSYKEEIPQGRPVPIKTDAARLFGDALTWLGSHKQERTFTFIFTLGTHAPLRELPGCTDRYYEGSYKGPLRSLLGGRTWASLRAKGAGPLNLTMDDRRWVRALYLGELTCHDQKLGLLVAGLKGLGILDQTLLIVTADHGEEFFDHNSLGHGTSLYDELIRIPLIVRYPPLIPAGVRIEDPVEEIDLAPTILDAVEVSPGTAMEGESILDQIQGEASLWPSYTVSEQTVGHRGFSVRTARYKYIVVDQRLEPRPPGHAADGPWPPSVMPPGVRLYDLKRDPGERGYMSPALSVAHRLCETLLGEALAVPAKRRRLWARGTPRRSYAAPQAPLDPELQRQLETLGYLGTGAPAPGASPPSQPTTGKSGPP